jgi:hypothetical protein
MRRELIPYYASRAVLSAVLGLIFGLSISAWVGVLTGLVAYAGFLWYAHNGRYLVDTRNPLFPLRRDDRGRAIRDRAVVIAVAVAGVTFALLSIVAWIQPRFDQAGSLAIVLGIVSYFVVSTWLFSRR